MYADGGIKVTSIRLLEEGLLPRIRLYRMSSDGLKHKVVGEFSAEDVLMHTNYGRIEEYVADAFGGGRYCAKLFSTKYGKNILECRYDFGIAGSEDEDDEDDEDA